MASVFIEDNYTATSTIEAVPGIHGEAKITYRPALNAKKRVWEAAAVSQSGEAHAKADVDLIRDHLESLNGERVPADRIAKIQPALMGKIIDRILGYVGSEEEKTDIKN